VDIRDGRVIGRNVAVARQQRLRAGFIGLKPDEVTHRGVAVGRGKQTGAVSSPAPARPRCLG